MLRNNKLILILLIFSSYLTAQHPSPAILETGYSVNNGYIIYPSPDSEYANIIEVGPGKTYQEIHDIPLNLIVKNTLVKIFYRAAPYQTKLFIDVVGTENEHLRFQGIPDANGTLPILTFENATNWGNNINQWVENIGTVVIYGSWGNKPAWIDIVNLHIKDSDYAGVWAKADHVSIKGCILENNPNGVFFQAANQLLIEISTYSTIEGCKFLGNGTVNGYLHHNIYSQAHHTLIQFNTIYQVQSGSLGASLKDRSSHTVIRYNYIETSSRTIDLVEPEDTDQILTVDSNWDDAYVYGNLLINKTTPVPQAGISMIHYGYDNTSTYSRAGTLYFANNTVIIDRNDGIWRMNLFDVNNINSNIKFSNNIVTAEGMHVFNIFRSNNTDNYGKIDFGDTWFSIINTDVNWQLNETAGTYSMTGQNNVTEGNTPGFMDSANDNYWLANNSPCVSAGENTNTSLGFPVNFNPIENSSIQNRTDLSNPNLGAFSIPGVASISKEKTTQQIAENYPNPFHEKLTISYNLSKPSHCKITIYTMQGAVVKTVINEQQDSGNHQVIWDGKNDTNSTISKGYYFYTLQTNKHIETHKILFY